MIDEILQYNKEFVENKGFEQYITNKYPNKKIAIVSCMDTRLTELLPAALGLKNGDAKIILVIGHTDCGARYTDSKKMIDKMKAHGITQENIDMVKYYGIDFDLWLGGFMDLECSINKSVELIRKHPLVPAEIMIYGLVIDSETGELKKIT